MSKKIQKSQKVIFFQKILIFRKYFFLQKKNVFLLVLPRRLVFKQSSPVQPISESRGGYPECDTTAVVVVVVAGRYFLLFQVQTTFSVSSEETLLLNVVKKLKLKKRCKLKLKYNILCVLVTNEMFFRPPQVKQKYNTC